MSTVLIAGSGRMAIDIGTYLLGQGCRVAWVSATHSRLLVIEKHAARAVRRLKRTGNHSTLIYSVHLLSDTDLAAPDYLLETTVESLPVKKQVCAALAERFPQALLLSNSSSIRPSRIHPRCLGMHFFYPVALTGIVELIPPPRVDPAARSRVETFAKACGLRMLLQDEGAAFAANRLLVPLQATCLRALTEGIPAEAVEAGSAIGDMDVGQLQLMDTVGLPTVAASVKNYRTLGKPLTPENCRAFIESLDTLISHGKTGATARNGLLCGEALPWPSRPASDTTLTSLRTRCAAVYVNTALLFLQHGLLAQATLDTIVREVHGAAESLSNLITQIGAARIRTTLLDLYQNSPLSFYRPSPLLDTIR